MSGMDPGLLSGVGPGGVSTEVVFASIPPCSTFEITCNQVNFLRKHDGTKSKNELLGNAFLLA